jgi:hypothetical protein
MSSRSHISILLLGGLTFAVLILAGALLKNSLQSSVVIEWSTASELDTVGFNIYRSESTDSPGVRINQQLIPASADSLTGADYQFIDTDAAIGKTYYYWLEDISASGAAGRNGPIEARSGDGLWLEWLLMVGLLAVLAWGWVVALWPRRTRAVDASTP